MEPEEPRGRQAVDEPRTTRLVLDLGAGRPLIIASLTVAVVTYIIWRGTPAIGEILVRLKAVCATLLLAVIVAYLVAPVVDRICSIPPFRESRPARAVAGLAVLVLFAAALCGLAVLTADPLIRELGELNTQVVAWLKDAPENIDSWLEAYSTYVPPEAMAVINERASELANQLLSLAGGMAVGAVWRVWSLVEAFLVPVLAFYFVTDSRRLLEGTVALAPVKHRDRVRDALRDMNATLHSYVRGQLILCLIAAVVTTLVLNRLHVPVFLTLGLLAGISRAVPVIGPIISGIAIVMITWVQVDFRAGVIAAIAFSVMQFLESKIVMPKVLGHHAALHPVIVIVALLAGGEFFGILGMLVAVPIVAVIKVGLMYYRAATRPVEAAPA